MLQLTLFIFVLFLNAYFTRILVTNARYAQLESVTQTIADSVNVYTDNEQDLKNPLLQLYLLNGTKWYKSITGTNMGVTIIDEQSKFVLFDNTIDFTQIDLNSGKTFQFEGEDYLFSKVRLEKRKEFLISYIKETELLTTYRQYVTVVSVLFTTLFAIYLIFSSLLLRKFDAELGNLQHAVEMITNTINQKTDSERKKIDLLSD